MSMTTKEQITAIVQAAIDGGWRLNGYVEKAILKEVVTDRAYFIQFGKMTTTISPPFIIIMIITKRSDGKDFYTPADLILNRGFMQAVYGKECFFLRVTQGEMFESRKCTKNYHNCTQHNCKEPSFIYHGLEASRISLTEGIELAIKYLYNNLPKEGSDDI
jgi:hypothetical protein